jgi:hypothetical protein
MAKRKPIFVLNKNLRTAVQVECIVHYQVCTEMYRLFLRQGFRKYSQSVLCRPWCPPCADDEVDPYGHIEQ